MKFDKSKIRENLYYEFKLGRTAAKAHRNLRVAFKGQVPSERTCERWFTKFRLGETCLKDQPRVGRPVEFDFGALLDLVKSDPRLTTREMASMLGRCQKSVSLHLAKLGYVQKVGSWIPRQLTDDQKSKRVQACANLLSLKSDHEWIKQIVTGDEKWVLYVNHTRKRQWLPADREAQPEPKGDLHPKKVMLSIFWDYKGILWFDLLPSGKTITAEVYSRQLQNLADRHRELRPQRSKVYFLHDNARPHTAKLTQQKLKNLNFEILNHAPYSPDLAPSDYHLFRSLSNFLREKKFDDFNHLKSQIETFFDSKSQDFYAQGILKLPERWRKVIELGGDYLTD